MNWAYIAGFFDGEGSVVKNKYSIGWKAVIPQLESNGNVLFEIKSFLEGEGVESRLYRDNCKSRLGTSQMLKLHICNQKSMLGFCEGIIDHVVVKKAKVFLAVQDAKKSEAKKQNAVERLNLAAKMYETGLSFKTLSKQHGCCTKDIRKRVVLLGIPVRPVGTNQFANPPKQP